mgnify:CR=1 FL=1
MTFLRSFALSLTFILSSSLLLSSNITLTLDGSSLNYDSDTDIAGFQFSHDGCASSAGGGDAAANAFMVSASSGVVIGFSMTGGVIPAGTGTLLDLGSEDCGENSLSSIVVTAPAGVEFETINFVFDDGDGEVVCEDEAVVFGMNCGTAASALGCDFEVSGTVVSDSCPVTCDACPDGEPANEVSCSDDIDVCLSLDGGNLNYDSSQDIAGFQWNHDGCISGASGGDAAGAGFTVSASSGVVIGFSFTGSAIASGSGVLTELSGDVTEGCISQFVFTGPAGVPLTSGWGTSDDDSACDDADSDGVCDDVDDCVGSLDECNVCNGDNSTCAGCDGVANSGLVNDACGVCDGDGSTCAGCDGVANSGLVNDACGVCDGDGSTCEGCDGVANSGLVNDACGVCDGPGPAADQYASDGACYPVSTCPAGYGLSVEATATSDTVCSACPEFTYSDTDDFSPCVETTICSSDEYELVAASSTSDAVCASCVFDCADVCNGSAVEDDCGVCGGDGSSCFASLSLGAFDASGSLEILYDFGSDVAGFQFDVSGLAIDGASGGAAGEAGFTVSVGSTTVLGVSFTGGTVPAGSGVLTTLSFSAVTGDSTELSLGNSGAVSTAAGDTLELSLSGSIAHTQDCAGTYYGDAVVDECGECNGPGPDTGFDCDGNCVDAGVCSLVTLTLANVTDSSADLLYSSNFDIGGFQFTTSGVTLNGVSSSLENTTFMASTGIVVGFSLTGVDLPAGEGTLATISFDPTSTGSTLSVSAVALSSDMGETLTVSGPDDADVAGCSEFDCAGDCGGSTTTDDCGVCGGDGSSCLASLSLGAFDASGSLEILYDFGSDVAGFQFDVSGLTLDGASGGAAEAAGFTVSTGPSMVLGISLTGGAVPAGSGVLTTLSFSAVTADSTDLSGVILTAPDGTEPFGITASGSIAHTQDCAGTYYGDAEDLGCGCNEAAPSGCDNVCGSTAVVDCAGECGGSASTDECGTCDADNSNDCIQDCAGEWGGSAEEDNCGTCDADSSNDCEQDCAGEWGGSAEDLGCGCNEAAPEVCWDGSSICDGECPSQYTDFSLKINSGWNWISLNVEPCDLTTSSNGCLDYDYNGDGVYSSHDMLINDVLSSLEEAGDQVATGSVQIKSNFGYADYYPNFGWFGSIEYIAVEKGYKLRFNHDSFDENGSSNVYLNYSGVPASASSHPITVYSGWNWLGYIPQEPMLADDALASLQSTGGDYIKTLGSYANYYDGFGWFGAEPYQMAPGKLYTMFAENSGTLVYPENNNSLARFTPENQSENLIDFENKFNFSKFEFNGSITSAVNIDDVVVSESDILTAYVGDEIRGISSPVIFPLTGEYIFNMMVYSSDLEEEGMTFTYYNAYKDELYDLSESMTFTSDMMVGNGLNAYLFHSKDDEMIPSAYGLENVYPNPFNPSTTINYSTSNQGFVNITIYDLAGRVVKELVSENKTAGTYDVVWNADNHPSGMYFVRLDVNGFSQTEKIMLVK